MNLGAYKQWFIAYYLYIYLTYFLELMLQTLFFIKIRQEHQHTYLKMK